jgi:outer membrane protein TolC
LQVEIAKRGLQQARIHLGDVQVARDTGVASNADVLSVDAQVSNAELTLTRAEAAAELLDKRIRMLMHDTSDRRYEIGEDLREAGTTVAAHNEHQLVVAALTRRLEPQALAQSAEAVRANADAVLARELPRLDAVASALYGNPNPRAFPPEDEFTASWQAGLQLTFTPTDIAGGEAERGSLKARARSLDAERADLTDEIELEVKQQLLAVRESEAAVRTAERSLVSAEEAYRVRRTLFQNGRATSIELSDTEADWTRAQSEVIAARIDHRIAQTRLAHAAGDDVAGGAR